MQFWKELCAHRQFPAERVALPGREYLQPVISSGPADGTTNAHTPPFRDRDSAGHVGHASLCGRIGTAKISNPCSIRNSTNIRPVGLYGRWMREAHPHDLKERPCMRKFVLTAAVAIIAAASFAAPSQAGYYNDDCQPYCYVKKVRTYDYDGNLIIKKIRVCE
jgi:hypothetical protein